MAAPPGAHRGLGIAALCAHAGHQQRQTRRQLAHARQFIRESRSHHQAQLPVAVPLAVREPCHALVQQLAVGQALALQVGASGVGGAAEQKCALAGPPNKRLDRVPTHKGRERHRVSIKAVKRLARVLLGGAADVAPLGVQNHRNAGRHATNMRDQALQLRLGPLRREVGDLRFECNDEVCSGVHDCRAKVKDARGVGHHALREAAGLRV